MKKIFLLFLIVLLSACEVGKQKKDFEIIADCEFKLEQIETFNLANVPLEKMMQSGEFDFSQFPNLAVGLFQKDIPLDAKIILSAYNPSKEKASLSAFDYLIFIEDIQIAEGKITEKTEFLPESETKIPISVQGNVYETISTNQQKWINLLSGQSDEGLILKIKVKPSIDIVGTEVKMPGYLTFEHKIDAEILKKHL